MSEDLKLRVRVLESIIDLLDRELYRKNKACSCNTERRIVSTWDERYKGEDDERKICSP